MTRNHAKPNFQKYAVRPGGGQFRPTDRQIRWLTHIDRHGPQSSIYLHALTQATHRSKDTALRQLQKLRQAGFLYLPRQQRATEHSSFNPYIYDTTDQAREILFEKGINPSAIRPSGHWVHGYMTACVTSSLEITAARREIGYLPADQIVRQSRGSLALTIGTRRLIPDQLFALNYGGAYRVCALEVDRSTEPKTTTKIRKSYANALQLYSRAIESKAYQTQYGIKSNLLVLWVFASRRNQQTFLQMLESLSPMLAASTLTQTVIGFHLSWRPPPVWDHLLENPWERAGHNSVSLNSRT